MTSELFDVLSESLHEARTKFRQYWKYAEDTEGAVNFALGLFTGILLRRIEGKPDPDRQEGEG